MTPIAPHKDVLTSADWQRRIDELAASLDIPGAQIGLLSLGSAKSGERAAQGEDQPATVDIRVMNTGVASRRHGAPVTDRTVFHYGSISKVWTTTLLMQLIDEGAITLDATIAEVLPQLRTDRDRAPAEITVRHLLTHTSGIEGDFFRFTGEDDGALAAYMEQIVESQSVTAPGGPLSYCNTGFSIAGAMAAELRGALWDDLVTSRIAGPLGVTDILTKSTDAGLFATAVGHAPGADGDAAAPVPMWQLPRSLGPAGLIVGTANTLLRFAAAHLRDGLALTGERVLSAESAIAMRQFEASLEGISTTMHGWGLGWMLSDWGTPAVSHSGSTIGQTSNLVLFPELGIALCVLTNAATGTAFIAAVEDMVAEELGLTRPAPREDSEADQQATRDLVGQWHTPWLLVEIAEDESGEVRVSMQEKRSIAAGAPKETFGLRAAGDNRFLFDRFERPVEVARIDHDGREFIWAGRLLERVAAPAEFGAATEVAAAEATPHRA